MASAIMATGLAPARAFHVAEVIEQRLTESDRTSIGRADLTVSRARRPCGTRVGARYAESFAKWQMVNRPAAPRW